MNLVSCRRGDVSSPIGMTPPLSPMFTPLRTSYFDHSTVDIMPRREPTIVRPRSFIFPDTTSTSSIFSTGTNSRHQEFTEQESEQNFTTDSFLSSSASNQTIPSRRPNLTRSSTLLDTTIPSLIHSPSSSFGTAGSTFSYRSPIYHRHSSKSPSTDLIHPFPVTAPSSPTQFFHDASLKSRASTLTSLRIAEATELTYDRHHPPQKHSLSPSVQTERPADRSLRRLFSDNGVKTLTRKAD